VNLIWLINEDLHLNTLQNTKISVYLISQIVNRSEAHFTWAGKSFWVESSWQVKPSLKFSNNHYWSLSALINVTVKINK